MSLLNSSIWKDHSIKNTSEGLDEIMSKGTKLSMEDTLHSILWEDSTTPKYYLGKLNTEYVIVFKRGGFTKFVPSSGAYVALNDVLGLSSAVNHIQTPSKWVRIMPKKIRDEFLPQVHGVTDKTCLEHLELLKKLVGAH